jgi:CubicO group peptidase (beta-lactamase class C family)
MLSGHRSLWAAVVIVLGAAPRFLCLGLASALFLQGQPAASRYAEHLDPFLHQLVREQKMPGFAIGIVENDRLVYARGFGVMQVGDAGRPVTPKTLFHMASITKPFVATSIMQLVERGKVELDAPVIRYVPYFRIDDPRYRAITVRQMVTHTSGMPDVENYEWDKPQYDDGALERYVRSLGSHKLRWAPGRNYAYSNMAFEVLGDLVAKVSGMSFDDYVDENILKPLGMVSSSLLIKKVEPTLLAAGHRVGKDGAHAVVKHYPYNRAHTPSSNLHSNVEDMARWMSANLNRGELGGHRILNNSAYDVMWKPAAKAGNATDVGISWFLMAIDGEQTVGHAGGDDGFRTNLILVPARKIGIVHMTNSESYPRRRIDVAALRVALGKNLDASSLPAR